MRFTGDDDNARTNERIPRRWPPHCAKVELEGNTLTLTTRGNSNATGSIPAAIVSAGAAIWAGIELQDLEVACVGGFISMLCTIWSIFELRSLLRVRCTRSPGGRIDVSVFDRRFRTRTYDLTVRPGTMPVRMHIVSLYQKNRRDWQGMACILWIDNETGVTLGISRQRGQQSDLLRAIEAFFGQRAPLGARLLGRY